MRACVCVCVCACVCVCRHWSSAFHSPLHGDCLLSLTIWDAVNSSIVLWVTSVVGEVVPAVSNRQVRQKRTHGDVKTIFMALLSVFRPVGERGLRAGFNAANVHWIYSLAEVDNKVSYCNFLIAGDVEAGDVRGCMKDALSLRGGALAVAGRKLF